VPQIEVFRRADSWAGAAATGGMSIVIHSVAIEVDQVSRTR
jgi:hypothetical protein